MPRLDYQIPIIEREQIAAPNSAIPWDESHPLFDEPMIRIEPLGIGFESYHAIDDGSNWPYHRRVDGSRRDGWLRRTYAEKLVAVNDRLRPYGAEMFVLDAYRCMDCQRGLWQFFYDRGRAEMPEAGDEDWTRYALGYVRDPRHFDRLNSRTFPAHATGASVDVTLRDLDTKRILNMGSNFEEIIDVSYTDYFERKLQDGEITEDDERLQNRRLLHWAFTMEGFLNDPLLYWHHDWGNQPWVKVMQALNPDEAPAAAWYAFIDDPVWAEETEAILAQAQS